MESVVIGLAEDMEYEDDFDPMGVETVGYEMVGIAEAFRDIAVLEDLGFDDDASDAALTVASAMVEVSCIPKYRSESAALLQSAEEIRSYVDEGSPGSGSGRTMMTWRTGIGKTVHEPSFSAGSKDHTIHFIDPGSTFIS